MFAGGGVKGGAWCPYVAQIDKTDPTAVVLVMNDFAGRGFMKPPHYTFTPVYTGINSVPVLRGKTF